MIKKRIKLDKMIKIVTSTLIGLLFTTVVMAQELKKKNWSDGKLSWQDFTERDGGMAISELKYYLGYHTDKEKMGDTIVYRNKAIGYMDKNFSWVTPAFKIDQYLRYNQVIFDIVEIHRRRLQYELDRVNYIYETEGKLNSIYNSCNTEIEKFKRESNEGRLVSSIEFWEQTTNQELESYNNNRIPTFENRNFGYGIHAGFGTGVFTGSLAEHFSPTFNFIFGFDFAYKKSIFFLNASIGFDKVKEDYIADINWNKGQRTNVAIADISYGYPLIDNKTIKLSPFVGLGFMEISEVKKNDEEKGLRMNNCNLILGLNTDFKLKTRLSFIPNPVLGVKEKLETAIRARLYVTKANYYNDLNGYSINFSLGFSGFGNMIRLK